MPPGQDSKPPTGEPWPLKRSARNSFLQRHVRRIGEHACFGCLPGCLLPHLHLPLSSSFVPGVWPLAHDANSDATLSTFSSSSPFPCFSTVFASLSSLFLPSRLSSFLSFLLSFPVCFRAAFVCPLVGSGPRSISSSSQQCLISSGPSV